MPRVGSGVNGRARQWVIKQKGLAGGHWRPTGLPRPPHGGRRRRGMRERGRRGRAAFPSCPVTVWPAPSRGPRTHSPLPRPCESWDTECPGSVSVERAHQSDLEAFSFARTCICPGLVLSAFGSSLVEAPRSSDFYGGIEVPSVCFTCLSTVRGPLCQGGARHSRTPPPGGQRFPARE